MSDTATPTASYLTQEAFDRLKAELDQLSGEGRTEIAKKIEAARDEGDLKENGGYHAAKEEQGKMEARIRQLTQLLENATVGEAPADNGVVTPGMVVTVEMFGDDMTFLLGSREIADGSDLEVYSEKSPLGAAIAGKKIGDTASVPRAQRQDHRGHRQGREALRALIGPCLTHTDEGPHPGVRPSSSATLPGAAGCCRSAELELVPLAAQGAQHLFAVLLDRGSRAAARSRPRRR